VTKGHERALKAEDAELPQVSHMYTDENSGEQERMRRGQGASREPEESGMQCLTEAHPRWVQAIHATQRNDAKR
jgi:hypothetical protein